MNMHFHAPPFSTCIVSLIIESGAFQSGLLLDSGASLFVWFHSVVSSSLYMYPISRNHITHHLFLSADLRAFMTAMHAFDSADLLRGGGGKSSSFLSRVYSPLPASPPLNDFANTSSTQASSTNGVNTRASAHNTTTAATAAPFSEAKSDGTWDTSAYVEWVVERQQHNLSSTGRSDHDCSSAICFPVLSI